MKARTFFLSGNESNAGRLSRLPAYERFIYVIVFSALAAGAVGGCASNGKVAARKPYNGVKIGAAVYDSRTRNFEKPWPFGEAPGPGGNFN